MLGVGSNIAVLLAARSRLGSVPFFTYFLTYYLLQAELAGIVAKSGAPASP